MTAELAGEQRQLEVRHRDRRGPLVDAIGGDQVIGARRGRCGCFVGDPRRRNGPAREARRRDPPRREEGGGGRDLVAPLPEQGHAALPFGERREIPEGRRIGGAEREPGGIGDLPRRREIGDEPDRQSLLRPSRGQQGGFPFTR